MKKLFVVDTNVVLFDHTCIYNFEEHDVALSIVVLEELDRFKRGNDLINFEAREFVRELDQLAGDGPLTEGLPLGEGRGRLFVEVGEPGSTRVNQVFSQSKPDHRILALAEGLQVRHPERSVILVSKDVNLRMKAKSLGMVAEDYTTGKVRHVDRLYTGTASFEGLPSDTIARLHQEPHRVPPGRRAVRSRSAPALPEPVPGHEEREPQRPGSPQPDPGRPGAGGQAPGLRRRAPQRRADLRPRRPDAPRGRAHDPHRAGRHRQDAPGPRRRPRAAAGLPPDLPGPARGSHGQSGHRLPARRHQEQARSLHAAPVGQLLGHPAPLLPGEPGEQGAHGDDRAREDLHRTSRPTSAAAPSTTSSSSWTRPRT